MKKDLALAHPLMYALGMETLLTTVWESYERNGDGYCLFKTKELAENHTLFEISHVSECEVWLSPDGVEELNTGKAIF